MENVFSYDGQCRKQTVVYEASFPELEKSYIGKTQQHAKLRIQEHISDVWKVICHGTNKCGNNEDLYGSGGHKKADAFAKFAGNVCRDCQTKNEVNKNSKKQKMKSMKNSKE